MRSTAPPLLKVLCFLRYFLLEIREWNIHSAKYLYFNNKGIVYAAATTFRTEPRP